MMERLRRLHEEIRLTIHPLTQQGEDRIWRVAEKACALLDKAEEVRIYLSASSQAPSDSVERGRALSQAVSNVLDVLIDRELIEASPPDGNALLGEQIFDALEALAAIPSAVASDDVVEWVARAIWREDHYDPKLCGHGGDGGDSCAYCEPHDDDSPNDWPADIERAERQARAAIAALQAVPAASEVGWQPIESAPYDTPVRVKLGNSMAIVARLMPDASMNDEGKPCDQWQAQYEGEHPECWTDGACWESNADGLCSMQPRAWTALKASGEE
jgi:hypothetical protein